MIFKNISFNQLNLDQVQFLLLCCIPIGLIFSIFIADFFLVIISITFIYAVRKNIKKYFNNIFFKFFFLFWILIVLRSLTSEDVLFSLKSSLFYIRFGIFFIAVKYIFEKKLNRIFFFFTILLFTLSLTGLDGILQFLTGKNVLGYEYYHHQFRMSGFFKDELIIGSFLTRLMPVLLGLYFLCKHHNFFIRINEFFFLLLVTFVFLIVLLSGERVSAFFYFIVFITSFLFFDITKIKKILILIFLFFSIILFSINSDVLKKRMLGKTLQQIGIVDTTEPHAKGIYFFSIHHHYHAIAAYKIFKENIFFGAGTKMFRKICDKRHNINVFTCTTHPHNIILQFLAETGLAGFIFYFIMLSYTIISIIKIICKKIKFKVSHLDRAKYYFLLSILFGIFPILPSGNFFNNWLSIILFFPIGLYFLIKNE